MKILQISEADHSGGAERIAHDLHRSATDAGHTSQMLVGYKRHSEPAVTGLVPQNGLRRFAYRCIASLERRSGRQAYFYWMAGSWLRDNPGWDIVHLHNLHGKYFNLGLLPGIAGRSRLIVTLHDCWLFTGHCAYVFDCRKWITDCHPCADLSRYPEMGRDAARSNLGRKKRLIAEAAPLLVTPSRWLQDLVEKSEVCRDVECRVIANGIDTNRFRPGDKMAARRRLVLPADKRLVLYVVNGGLNSTQYKDPALLLSAVEILLSGKHGNSFHVVVVGGKKKISQRFDSCVTQIDDTRDGLETFYQAADILVYPTKADNCPLVPMEAMSCGLPVVSTRVGGVPEVVSHGATGYVTPPGDAAEFAGALEALLSSRSMLTAMGAAAIERVGHNFTLERMRDDYLRLYQENRKRTV